MSSLFLFHISPHTPERQRSGTPVSLNQSPSEILPTCVQRYLQATSPDTVAHELVDLLVPLILASGGALVVTPDLIGYGESYNYNRTFLSKLPYEQAFIVSYLAAQDYVQQATGGCTQLSSELVVSGYGEGGYAAVVGALALKSIGMFVSQLFVGGAPLNLQVQLAFMFQTLESVSPPADGTLQQYWYQVFLSFMGLGYSNSLPFLANTGTDQAFLDPTYISTVINRLKAPNPKSASQLFPALPQNLLTLINSSLLLLFKVGFNRFATLLFEYCLITPLSDYP